MKTTMLSEARDGKVTITLRLPFKEASMLLDVVTDSVLLGNTKGDVQEWAEQLMRDLDDHLQRNEESQDNPLPPVPMVRCIDCGFFHSGALQDCPNCGND